MKNYVVLYLLVLIIPSLVLAESSTNNSIDLYKQHPLYAGLSFGYGASTWKFLVPLDPNNDALELSTPTEVREGGKIWGLVIGYEFLPTFGLEFSYDSYPTAKIHFSDRSIFSLDHNYLENLYTETETYSIIGKFMVLVPKNPYFRVYASAGPAAIYRQDIINETWQITAKFGLGCNFLVNENFMVEFGADYTAGDGVSELSPADHFVPFLYSIQARFLLRV